MLKLHIGKFFGNLQSRVHELKARRKNDLVALIGQIPDHALGIGHRRHILNELRLNAIAELLLDDFASFIVLLAPSFVGTGARVEPGGLEHAGIGRGSLLLRGRLAGRLLLTASAQSNAGSSG